jgi:hypothetical protein
MAVRIEFGSDAEPSADAGAVQEKLVDGGTVTGALVVVVVVVRLVVGAAVGAGATVGGVPGAAVGLGPLVVVGEDGLEGGVALPEAHLHKTLGWSQGYHRCAPLLHAAQSESLTPWVLPATLTTFVQ